MTNTSPNEDPAWADEMLDRVDALCRERDIAYFLYGGTCLGLYRNRDYLDDNDLDVVAVCSAEAYRELWAALAASPGWSDGSGLRKGPMQLDFHYTPNSLPYVIPSWRPVPYTFMEFDIIYHRSTDREYKIPAPVEDYLDWEFLGAWRTVMSRETWDAIDTSLQKLLGYKG